MKSIVRLVDVEGVSLLRQFAVSLAILALASAWTTVAVADDAAPPLAPGAAVAPEAATDESPAARTPLWTEKDLSFKFDPATLADAAAAPTTEKLAPAEGKADEPKAEPEKKPLPPNTHCAPSPLPLYNVEGQGGTLLVPMAYMVNCESPGTIVGMPTAGYTFVRAGTKTVQEVHTSETFFRRIELGYTMGTLNLGDFPRDVRRATGVDIGFDDVVLHNFNLRGIVIEEGPYNPSIAAGATFKYNPDVQKIDERLHGGVRGLGMARSNSVDYTLTASKMVIDPCLKRPVIFTGGIRFSEAAQLGYLGFGDTYRMTGEGSVVYVLTDWLAIAYEYRQKKNPYDTLGTLVGKEGAWQAIDFAFIIDPHLTFAVGWLCAGNVANGRVDNGWGFQLKYEF